MVMESLDSNIRSNDRILELAVIDGKSPLSSTGMVDTRLFTGGNRLHAVMDPENCLWRFKYDDGVLPGPLKGIFTSFKTLRKFAEDYFSKRNIKITEVKD